MQYIWEKLDCDLGWRIMKNRVIRFTVSVIFTLLFALAVREEWNETKPITGDYNDYVSVQGVAVQEDIRNFENALAKLPRWIVESYYERCYQVGEADG